MAGCCNPPLPCHRRSRNSCASETLSHLHSYESTWTTNSTDLQRKWHSLIELSGALITRVGRTPCQQDTHQWWTSRMICQCCSSAPHYLLPYNQFGTSWLCGPHSAASSAAFHLNKSVSTFPRWSILSTPPKRDTHLYCKI